MTGTGGGAATNAGIDFQQRYAALAMTLMLTGHRDLRALGLDRGVTAIRELRAESADAVDDLVLVTDGSKVLVQAKNALDLSALPSSELSGVISQFVAQFLRNPGEDERYVIAVSPAASGRIRNDLGRLADASRLNVRWRESNPRNQGVERTLTVMDGLIDRHWRSVAGRSPTGDELAELWRRMHVAVLDLRSGGSSEALAIAALAHRGFRHPEQVWGSLVAFGLTLARDRMSVDRAGLDRRFAGGLPTRIAMAWDSPGSGDTVDRPELMSELLAAVEPSGNGEVTVLTGVHGAGGFGKTTLVKQLSETRQLRHAYENLLWVTLGEDVRGATLAARINDVTARLTGERPDLSDPQQAGFRLGSALDACEGRVLLVLDDVWHRTQLLPFLTASADCTLLVTTRNRSVVENAAHVVLVDRMTAVEADAVLTAGLPAGLPDAAVSQLKVLTGRWPVLLGIAHRMLRRLISHGLSPATAASTLIDRLRSRGPAALDLTNPSARDEAVAATVEAGLALMAADARDRYRALAVFAEDAWIPMGLLETYWDLDTEATERACLDLADLSMLSDLRLDTCAIRLHDVLRAYLIAQQTPARMTGLHGHLLDAVDVPAWWDLPNGYLADHLVEHLLEAGRASEAADLVGDLRWTEARIRGGGVTAVEGDLALVASPASSVLSAALARNGHLLDSVEPPFAVGAVLACRLSQIPELADAAAEYASRLPGPRLSARFALPDRPHPWALRVLGGHAGGITHLAVSPDGRHLAVVEEYGTVLVRDAKAGSVTARLDRDGFGVDEVRFAPDGSWLATIENAGIEGGRVRLWDVATGQILRTFPTRSVVAGEETVSAAFSPAYDWLAVVDFEEDRGLAAVVIWDVATGEKRRTIYDHDGWAHRLVLSPDGTRLATGDYAERGEPASVRLWDPESGELIRVLDGHRGPIRAIGFGRGGHWLCTADGEGVVRAFGDSGASRYEWPTGMRWPELAVAPDGTWLTAYDERGRVLVFDLASGAERYSLPDRPAAVRLAIAPDSAWFAVACRVVEEGDGASSLWICDAATGEVIEELSGHGIGVGAVAVAPDGTWLVGGDDTKYFPDGGEYLVRTWRMFGEPPAAPSIWQASGPAFAVSPADGMLAFGGGDELHLVDASSGRIRWSSTELAGVSALAFGSYGDQLIVADEDGLALVETATGALRGRIGDAGSAPGGVVVAPTGEWAVTWGIAALDPENQRWGAPARAWELPTGRCLGVLGEGELHGNAVLAPDGSYVATSGAIVGADQVVSVSVRDPHGGALLATLDGHREGARVLAAAPDSSRLITGEEMISESAPGIKAFVWDARTGQRLHSLDDHVGCVECAAVDPDGRWLATGDRAGDVRLWDAATGRRLAVFVGRAAVVGLDVSRDGRLLAACESGGGTGSVRVFDTITRTVLTGMGVDGTLHGCRWLPDGSGLVLSGSRGLYVFDLRM